MRKSAVVLLCIWFVLPALAAKRVTVDQLKQSLETSRGKADAKVAEEVSGLELSERLSWTDVAQLQGEAPGPETKQALTALADASVFMDPHAAEIVTKGAPTVDEQRRIMGLVAVYVSKTIPQLPNFIAARETTRYEDTPLIQKAAGFVPYQPMHRVGNEVETVTYRAGREEVSAADPKSKKQKSQVQGLTTWGVFGSILSTVLLDAAQSKLAWDHWEKDPSGEVAVFVFEVPKEKSHYEVNYCCYWPSGPDAGNPYPFRRIVGYRGKMAVNPETGTIVRLTVEAELGATDPVVEAAIMVEYRKVDIGGKPYVCPVRSVSKTRAEVVQTEDTYKYQLANQAQPLRTQLNDVTFEKYQVFRADATVLY